MCDCSVSKISKLVKKIGFSNYKQFLNYACGKEIVQKQFSSELNRIKNFVENFDLSLVENFIEAIEKFEKVILFGYGPSFICAQYFEYKLRIVTKKTIIAVPDEISAQQLLDEKSILIIFSTTGKFVSFESIAQVAKSKNSEILPIVEEYNTDLLKQFDRVFFLTNSFQTDELLPYEKSRSFFFIFIEEVIKKIMEQNH